MAMKMNDPLPTEMHTSWEKFALQDNSTYFFGTSEEERSYHPIEWEQSKASVDFIKIWSDETVSTPFSSCSFENGNNKRIIHLRAGDELIDYIDKVSKERIYLDITGLSHGVWAPILRACLGIDKPLSAVYVEPRSYSFSETPTEAEIFDLSSAIRDIFPLPGFTSFAEPESEDDVVFIPLLGFEGHRLAYVLEKVQPPIRMTYPIVGVPGFKPEYPFHTYLGNKNILLKHKLYTRVRYAVANSASDVYYQLSSIADSHPNSLVKIAPVGTKPHSLGAILFAICASRPVEIVYDHPIRKPQRTSGNANILVYNIDCIVRREFAK